MFYTIKAPWLIKKLYPSLLWEKPTKEKILYLTFDDGPHSEVTPFVLDQLKQYNAKATFFCIGRNVVEQPKVYRQILEEEHKVGNHTYDHLNGFKTNNNTYIKNVFEAAKYIDSDLFRPPYGRITKFQVKLLTDPGYLRQSTSALKSKISSLQLFKFKIVMWSIVSGDFDTKISPEKCLQNVILNVKSGDIIVFHDSAKAWERLRYTLPRTLKHFKDSGYIFRSL